MGSVLRWPLNAVLVAVACLLAADTANEVVAAMLLAPSVERGVADRTSPAAPPRTWTNRQVILERDLFHTSTQPPPLATEPEQVEKSQLPVTLLGTFATNDPALSRAALLDRESQDTFVVAVGDAIRDQALVVRIDPRQIVLRENGALRELTLGEAHSPVIVPQESTPTHSIRVLSEGRVLPKVEGTEMIGVEVNTVRAGSLFEKIGLANGDVITELNGVPADSPEIAQFLQEMSTAQEYRQAYHLVGYRADGSEHVWDFVPADG